MRTQILLVCGFAPETPPLAYGKKVICLRNRNIQRKVYLNEDEDKKLKKIIDESGMTLSQIFRSYILGTEIKPRPPDEIIKLYRELSAIGNNINQLAYKANGLGVMNVEEVKKMRIALEKIWDKAENI